MIDKIEIKENYYELYHIYIGDLLIKNLNRINIFIGDNGVGKTAILNYIKNQMGIADCYSVGDGKPHLNGLVKEREIAISARLHDVVLIDEIEYKLDRNKQLFCSHVFMETIGFVPKTQLFITTHSYEFIKTLFKVAEKENKQDLISVFRLKQDCEYKPNVRSFCGMELACIINNNFDISYLF